MAAGATYEPIATTTLGSAASSITFSSIAASWTDLKVVLVATANTTTFDIFTTFNLDSGTNYSRTQLAGSGVSTATGKTVDNTYIYTDYLGTSTTIPSIYTLDIFSYADSKYKTCLNSSSEDRNGSGYVAYKVALWRSTAAITRIDMAASGDNYAAGTTATLYGIKNA